MSEGSAEFNYTVTNLGPVHKMSEGNAGGSLCALGSYIHEGCAAHLNQETRKQPVTVFLDQHSKSWSRDIARVLGAQ